MVTVTRHQERSLTAALRATASTVGDSRGLTYCPTPDACVRRGYAELDERARAIADALARAGYEAGDAVVIGLRQGICWVEAVHGVLYAGMIAVPVDITGTDQPEKVAQKITGMAIASQAAVVITDSAGLAALAASSPSTGTRVRSVLISELVAGGRAESWAEPEIGPNSPALLLFTSGSTSDPKGVVATHRSLVVEAQLTSAALGFTERTVFGGWLPLYHPMGLTLQWLTPAVIGADVVLTPPEQFQRRPMSWLKMLSDFRATASAAGNFAFELCVKFASDEQVAALDLSRLEVVVSGGEPVRSAAVAAFAERFAAAGFRTSAVTPAIGMTETMLYCAKTPEEELVTWQCDAAALEAGWLRPSDGGAMKELASCGRPFAGVSVRIVDPATGVEVPDRRVGEIWVSTPAMSAGYLDRPDLTAQAFGNRVTGDDRDYLRTGDLGVMIDGELFVTGRLKDVIIIRGRNLYPQDMEGLTQGIGVSAAFQLDDAPSPVGIVIEFDPGALIDSGDTLEGLASAVRGKLTQRFSLPSVAVGFVTAGSLSRTPTGKVQRNPTRAALLAGRMPVAYSIGFAPVPVIGHSDR